MVEPRRIYPIYIDADHASVLLDDGRVGKGVNVALRRWHVQHLIGHDGGSGYDLLISHTDRPGEAKSIRLTDREANALMALLGAARSS